MTADESHDAKQQLAGLFMETSRAVARRLNDGELPLTRGASRTIVERSGPASWAAIHDEYDENVLRDNTLVNRHRPWLTGQLRADLRVCAEDIATTAERTLPFVTMTAGAGWSLIDSSVADSIQRPPRYEADPAAWVERFIILPALIWQLRQLTRVDRVDSVSAASFADDVLRVAHDDHLRYRVDLALSGIQLEGDDICNVSDARLRRLSGVEQGDWLTRYGWPAAISVVNAEPPDVVVEIAFAQPRLSQPAQPEGLAQRFIAAFLLHGHRPAGHFATEQSDPPWVSLASGLMQATLPWRATKQTSLTRADFERIVATAELLETTSLKYPRSAQDLALHRFMAGAAREDVADAVLDLTIALEALLLPDDRQARRSDLTYRFRVHGAHYLSPDPGVRLTTLKRLNGIYDLRSRLVHGGKYPEFARIATARDDAFELARYGLFRAIHEGFPTAEQFNEMVLGLADAEDPEGV